MDPDPITPIENPFQTVTSRVGMLNILILHICRLTGASWRGMRRCDVFMPGVNWDAMDEEMNSVLESPNGYSIAAQYLLHMLCPELRGRADWDEVTGSRVLHLNLLRSLWQEIVVEESDPNLAFRAEGYARRILVRSPQETAYFVCECLGALGLEGAQHMLADSYWYARSERDAQLLVHAYQSVCEGLMERFRPPGRVPIQLAPDVKVASPASLPVTASHRAVQAQLLLMGKLFYGDIIDPFKDSGVRPRYAALICGPTGVGKSHLVRKCAEELGCRYYKVTRGDWVPLGANVSAGGSTTFHILDLVLQGPGSRVVVHIDELDKLAGLANGGARSDWGASIQTDIWNTLDYDFPWEAYRSHNTDIKLSDAQIRERLKKELWFVASGTFQHLFEKVRDRGVGFSPSVEGAVDGDVIHESRHLPAELLARFHFPVILRYPDLQETKRLLEVSGINALAAKLGRVVKPESIAWERGGIRVLESLATELAVAFAARISAPLRPLAKHSVPVGQAETQN